MTVEAEANLTTAHGMALQRPLDGITPPTNALAIELPLGRVAVAVVSAGRYDPDGHGPQGFWIATVMVRDAENPLGKNLPHEAAAKVAAERALDGVGTPPGRWQWEPDGNIGHLLAHTTNEELALMAKSPTLPPDTLPGSVWYMRPNP